MTEAGDRDDDRETLLRGNQPLVKHRPRIGRTGTPAASPAQLGRLAPPRDPKAARGRRIEAAIRWGAVAVVIACAVLIAVWFAAR